MDKRTKTAATATATENGNGAKVLDIGAGKQTEAKGEPKYPTVEQKMAERQKLLMSQRESLRQRHGQLIAEVQQHEAAIHEVEGAIKVLSELMQPARA